MRVNGTRAAVKSIQLLIIESQILHLVIAGQRSRNWIVQLSDRNVVDACWVHLLGLISEVGDLYTHVRYDNPCAYRYISIVVKVMEDEDRGIHVEWRKLNENIWHVKDVLCVYLCIRVRILLT